jgi:hypothetical protein
MNGICLIKVLTLKNKILTSKNDSIESNTSFKVFFFRKKQKLKAEMPVFSEFTSIISSVQQVHLTCAATHLMVPPTITDSDTAKTCFAMLLNKHFKDKIHSSMT